MRYQIVPLGTWTGPATEIRRRSHHRGPWAETMDLLAHETAQLGAGLVTIQIDAQPGDIRRRGDQMLVRTVSPAVRVVFDSMYGPLVYATDRFDFWQDNLRAIGLSLQALRTVDRYGVNDGRQYNGWRSRKPAPHPDVAAARALLESYGGEKAAIKKTHPDLGGDVEAFRAVDRARKLLATL
jgi:hypothetical protein